MWKEIKGYEGKYEVSDCGKVRSLDRTVEYINRYGNLSTELKKGRVLAQANNGKGYMVVNLNKNAKGKMFYVHRLVAQAFIGEIEGLTVNHLDFDTTNNHVSNLEICTMKENNDYSIKAGRHEGKTNVDKVGHKVAKCDLDGNILTTYKSMREAERENGLANDSVAKYFRKGYAHAGGFTWKKL